MGKIPCRYVEDTRFDLAGYVYREFGHCFGRAEENVCLNGVGLTEPKGLLHTADVGVTASTLTADAVIELFFSLDKKYRRIIVECDMSRKGESHDNAVAENFFSCLKCELVYLTSYATRRQAQNSIFRYIEGLYNPVRPHSFIG